jgi:hypothetical protein
MFVLIAAAAPMRSTKKKKSATFLDKRDRLNGVVTIETIDAINIYTDVMTWQ